MLVTTLLLLLLDATPVQQDKVRRCLLTLRSSSTVCCAGRAWAPSRRSCSLSVSTWSPFEAFDLSADLSVPVRSSRGATKDDEDDDGAINGGEGPIS